MGPEQKRLLVHREDCQIKRHSNTPFRNFWLREYQHSPPQTSAWGSADSSGFPADCEGKPVESQTILDRKHEHEDRDRKNPAASARLCGLSHLAGSSKKPETKVPLKPLQNLIIKQNLVTSGSTLKLAQKNPPLNKLRKPALIPAVAAQNRLRPPPAF